MTQLPSLLLLFISLSLSHQCLWWVLCGSEGMIIGSAAAVIVFEYTRNERKKARDKVKQRIKAEAKAKVSEPLNAIDLYSHLVWWCLSQLAARRFEDMEYRIARLEAALAANTVTLDARGRRTTGQGGSGSSGGGTRALLQPHATVVWAPLPPAHQHGSESLDETGDD